LSEDRSALESKIELLAGRLDVVEQRLAELERQPVARVREPAGEPVAEDETVATVRPRVQPDKGASLEIVPLIGRTLVVLGGAFALRAVTEMGMVPRAVGIALGIGYSILWLVLADRAAGKKRHSSAAFHALAATIIAYPLLWEATAKFNFLSPAAGALALAIITGLALAVASHRKLRPMAWVFTLAATATALALAVATKMLILYVSLVLLLGLATICLVYLRGWRGLGWFVAIVVDVAVLMLTTIALVGEGERVAEVIDLAGLVGLQLALVVLYLGTFYYRTLVRHEQVSAAAITQGIAVLIVGLGGGIAVTQTTSISDVPLGIVSLLLAVGSYGASFAFIDTALERRESFIFYTTLALVFTLVGFGVLVDGAARGIAYAAVGLFAAWLGAVRGRATLSLHGAVYVVAGAVSARLVDSATDAFTGPAIASAAWISFPTLVVLAAAAACSWFTVATHGKTWGRFSRMPKLVVLLVLLLGIGGVVVTLITGVIPRGEQAQIDPAALATLRTGVIALSAIALALLGRWERLPEAAWLVYPLLIAGGAKLLFEDLGAGRPLTLFISFALYGGALILAPRLARRRK
jgi:hypothetical protein